MTKHGQATQLNERRESAAVLPVVEEAAEGLSGESRNRNSHVSSTWSDDGRPLTPAKDGEERDAGFANPIMMSHGSLNKGRRPLTPPKSAYGQGSYLKPESADSGYGVSAANALKSTTGSQKSSKIRPQVSRESLDKALPPLPKDLISS
jgi:1-phosphatidylinositol-4-phosphate 5-kinase